MRFLGPLATCLLVAACATPGDGWRTLRSADFAQVRVGMTQDETMRLLGRPTETMQFARTSTYSWDYRYHDQWGYLALFSVTFDRGGTVVSTFSQRLNDGGDFGGSK